MKINFLPASGNAIWKKNKPFIVFVFVLLLIYSVLKIIFYSYNYHLIFNDAGEPGKLSLIRWSLFYDLLIILLINLPLLLLLQLTGTVFNKLLRYFILPLFILLNSVVILLNITDIFYYRFHFQRANADLLYVVSHPFQQLFHFNFFIIILGIIAVAGIIILMTKLCNDMYRSFKNGNRCTIITMVFALFIILIPFYKDQFIKITLPTYPLVSLNSKQLLIVQNSFHTFIYSVFRNRKDIAIKEYMPVAQAAAEFPLKKLLANNSTDTTKKNIVLFIMESIPYEFFDTASPYKVTMPFFDSLLQKSIFYNNAFCYAHESNKGITAILAGIPTLIDIPLYHSSFTNMPITAVGTVLQKNNYRSFFCIGDDYDNFGFAKCSNWLGIQQYYCKTDIPGYKDLPAHTMGIQDEYVLNFMNSKIDATPQPFFAVNYSISTHYPYDLPSSYKKTFPAHYTDPMKSMSYYDYSLQQFFNAARTKSWFANTVFIFCSDHWLMPDDKKVEYNAISGQRIPIIIFDPSVNEKKNVNSLVSQFDVMGTILAISHTKDSIISYGGNLLDSNSINKTTICKIDAGLYQLIDTAYVLGFNVNTDKPEYLYHYKTDIGLKENLLQNNSSTIIANKLTLTIKAVLQNATRQYHSRF